MAFGIKSVSSSPRWLTWSHSLIHRAKILNPRYPSSPMLLVHENGVGVGSCAIIHWTYVGGGAATVAVLVLSKTLYTHKSNFPLHLQHGSGRARCQKEKYVFLSNTSTARGKGRGKHPPRRQLNPASFFTLPASHTGSPRWSDLSCLFNAVAT